MRTMMKMIYSAGILLVLFVPYSGAHAQFGIGASGGMLHSGLIASAETNSQFGSGWGYELLLQHQLIRLSDSLFIDARYAYRQYLNPVELPYVLTTWFTFHYLTVNLLMDFLRLQHIVFYTGAGGSLLNSTASKDFLDYTGTSFLPEINLGCKWIPSKNYTVFSELSLQFGSLSDVLKENIPVTGVRFVIGGIMFLSNNETEE